MCFGVGLLCTMSTHSLVPLALIAIDSSHRLVRQRLVVKPTIDKRLDGRVVLCTGRDGRRVSVVWVDSCWFVFPLL